MRILPTSAAIIRNSGQLHSSHILHEAARYTDKVILLGRSTHEHLPHSVTVIPNRAEHVALPAALAYCAAQEIEQVVLMDATHDPQHIATVLREITNGNPIVAGVSKKGSLASGALQRIAFWATKQHVQDPLAGMVGCSVPSVKNVSIKKGHHAPTALLLQALRYYPNVPICHVEVRESAPQQSLQQTLRAARTLVSHGLRK